MRRGRLSQGSRPIGLECAMPEAGAVGCTVCDLPDGQAVDCKSSGLGAACGDTFACGAGCTCEDMVAGVCTCSAP